MNEYDEEVLIILHKKRLHYIDVLNRIKIIKKYKHLNIYSRYSGTDFDKEIKEMEGKIDEVVAEIYEFKAHKIEYKSTSTRNGYRTFDDLKVVRIDR